MLTTVFRLLAFATLGVWIALAPALAAAPPETGPRDKGPRDKGRSIIETIADQAVDILSDKGLSRAERETRFARLFRTHFDVPTVGPWVLGAAWERASADQRHRYMRLFALYSVKAFAVQLSSYKSASFSVTGAEPDGKGTVVRSTIARGGQKNATVLMWRLRHVDGVFKIRDVLVDGISTALTLRHAFAAIVRRQGNVDGLINVMWRKMMEFNARQRLPAAPAALRTE